MTEMKVVPPELEGDWVEKASEAYSKERPPGIPEDAPDPSKGITPDVVEHVKSMMFTGDEFLKQDFPPVVHRIAGLLTDGLNIVAGDSKCGKSWLSLDMAVAIAKGEEFCELPTTQSKVLLMPLEDMMGGLKERFLMSGVKKIPDNISILPYDPYITGGWKLELLDEVIEDGGYEVVFIDTYAKYMGPPEQNGNAYQSEGAEIQALQSIAHKHTICMVAFTHTNQSNYGVTSQHKVNGSTAFEGFSDNLLIISKGGITTYGRHIKQETHRFVFDQETFHWDRDGAPPEAPADPKAVKETRKEELTKAIYTVFKEAEEQAGGEKVELSISEIIEKVKGLSGPEFAARGITDRVYEMAKDKNEMLFRHGEKKATKYSAYHTKY